MGDKNDKTERPKQLEQFYSGDAVLRLMVQTLLEQVPECDIYIDPSAGDGALLRSAIPRSTQRLSFDVDPRSRTVQKCSFDSPQAQLSIERAIGEFERRRGRKPRVCVASNPPFKLIKRWLQIVEPWANWVMFLAPLQQQRLAYQDGIPPAYRLRWQQAVPDSQFLHEGELVARPTVLQVWQKRNIPAPQPLLAELGLAELGITQWRFAPWSEFRKLKAEKQYLLCFSAKTGQTWEATRLIQQQGLQRCGIVGSAKASQPTSVCRLMVCRSKLVMQRLLVIGRLVERLALPSGCTRDSFKSTEFAWLWLKRYAPQTWELHCAHASVGQLELSPLDAFLFTSH